MPHLNGVKFNSHCHLVFVPITEFESEDGPGILVDVVRNGELNRAGAEGFGPPFVDQNAIIGYTRHGCYLLLD